MSSFGLTSAAAIAISLIVSFTLTPMLAARWIKPVERRRAHAGDEAATHRGAASTATSIASTRRMLQLVDGAPLAHRHDRACWSSLSIVPAVPRLGRQLHAGRGRVAVPDFGAAAGRLEPRRDAVARRSRSPATCCEQLPGVLAVQGNAGLAGGGQGGNNAGSVFVRLKPIEERDVSAAGADGPGAAAGAAVPQVGSDLGPGHRRPDRSSGGRGAQIQYALVGPDLAKLDQYTAKAPQLMDKNPALVDVDRSFQPGLPELRLDIDRKRAADLGVRVQDISQTVNALIAGQKVTTFNAASDQYDVVLQGAGLVPPDAGVDCRAPPCAPASGELVQLRNLVAFNEGSGPAQIDRLEPAAPDHDLGKPGAGRLAGRGPGGARSGVRVARHGAGLQPRHQRSVARARPRRLLLRASPSRSRSSSCTWCWRRSSSRSSIRSPSC